MMIVRHLLAVLLLPFMVVVAVPYWLLNSWAEIGTRWTGLWPLGAALLAFGLMLFGWCVGLFARVGRGTLPRGTRRTGWLPRAPIDSSGIP